MGLRNACTHELPRSGILFPEQVWSRYFDKFDAAATVNRYYDRWAKTPTSNYYHGIEAQRQAGLPDEAIKNSILEKWAADGRAASAAGTRLHRDIELFLNGHSQAPWSPELMQFRKWLEEEATPRGWKPWRTEWSVFDEDTLPSLTYTSGFALTCTLLSKRMSLRIEFV